MASSCSLDAWGSMLKPIAKHLIYVVVVICIYGNAGCMCDVYCPTEELRACLRRAQSVFYNQALALNTKKSYQVGLKAYVLFCLNFGYPPFPATDDALAAFITFWSMSCSFRSIKVYLAAVGNHHLEQGMQWVPIGKREVVRRVYQGVKRMRGVAAKPKMAISLEDLLTMKDHLAVDDWADTIWYAAALTAFFLMLRKDNISVSKEVATNEGHVLKGSDVTPMVGDQRGFWVKIRASKTSGLYNDPHVVALLPVENSPLCPVTAIEKVIKLRNQIPFINGGQHDNTPLFMLRHNGPLYAPLTHKQFVQKLKSLIHDIGKDSKLFSGHSFRRGAATLAFSLGSQHQHIKHLGNWKSEVFLDYNQWSSEQRVVLPRLLADHAASLRVHPR